MRERAAGAGLVSYLRAAGAELGRSVDAAGWCAFVVDPDTGLQTTSVANTGLADEDYLRLFRIERDSAEANRFAELHRAGTSVGVLGQATGGVPARSRRFREVFAPAGFRHEARVLLRRSGRVWGALVLLRDGGKDFTAKEARFLGEASELITNGLLANLFGRTRSEALGQELALVTLDAEDRIVETSPSALTVLADGLEQPREGGATPLLLRSLALEVRSPPAGRSVRARIMGCGSRWTTLTAVAVGPPTARRVTIVATPTPVNEVAALELVARGLTSRETAVALLVLQGLSTEAIARQLAIAAYTVQDHLKAIFAKTGASSRKQLAERFAPTPP